MNTGSCHTAPKNSDAKKFGRFPGPLLCLPGQPRADDGPVTGCRHAAWGSHLSVQWPGEQRTRRATCGSVVLIITLAFTKPMQPCVPSRREERGWGDTVSCLGAGEGV